MCWRFASHRVGARACKEEPALRKKETSGLGPCVSILNTLIPDSMINQMQIVHFKDFQSPHCPGSMECTTPKKNSVCLEVTSGHIRCTWKHVDWRQIRRCWKEIEEEVEHMKLLANILTSSILTLLDTCDFKNTRKLKMRSSTWNSLQTSSPSKQPSSSILTLLGPGYWWSKKVQVESAFSPSWLPVWTRGNPGQWSTAQLKAKSAASSG